MAEQGDVDAQFSLGMSYLRGGMGVEKSGSEAERWLRAAADQRHAQAQYMLGLMYWNGWGVPKDSRKGVPWIQAAAEQGIPEAQLRIGFAYSAGEGVWSKNPAEGVRWYRRAANQGVAEAQYRLGTMYENGTGVAKDQFEAIVWYRAAADQGNASAQFNLAVSYAHGAGGLLRSGGAAADWYYKAGVNYLKQGEREEALLCVERIIDLQKVLGLTVPNAQLADQLQAALAGDVASHGSSDSQPSGESNAKAFGTGWVVDGGFIVTCHHVIEGMTSIAVRTPSGETTSAAVELADPVNDLALLRPENPAIFPTAIPIGKGVRSGETVFTVGHPHPTLLGLEAKLTDGIVSAQSGIGGDIRVVQVSVPVQAGNSGGPLLNGRGEVVGIVVSKLSAEKVLKMTGDLPENVNYAIKVAYLSPLLSSAQSHAKVRVLPVLAAPLADLASRIEDAVVLIIGW